MGWGYRGSLKCCKKRGIGLQGFRALAQDPSRFRQVSGSIGVRLLPSGSCAGFRVWGLACSPRVCSCCSSFDQRLLRVGNDEFLLDTEMWQVIPALGGEQYPEARNR